MGILTIDNVSKHFGGVIAVDKVNTVVEPGLITSIIGPNGAGKTTLFNLITGGYALTEGSIKFKDQELSGLPSHAIYALGIARTFQNIRLFPTMTVWENVMLGLQSKLKPNIFQALLPHQSHQLEREIRDRSLYYLEVANLLKRKDELSTALPYGEQRRLEIARALVSDPEIVLLDEPAAGMNVKEAKDLLKFIQWIKTDLKKTVIFIEHNMRVVMSISDKIVVLDHGRKIAEGTSMEVRENPLVIEAYLGTKKERQAAS
ncbi:ABC transporter ATP-binding protein [Candidatus Formimonas warabiya]|uniref:ABC transporter domain-containing protein n=1 Tax=Formimonas warabiya TaxID=1761012 RepID=A0A3G1KZE3_FORW1|nr:ABC transporter ATP-binding protein [Candidatus Formimonas warabiya]ATW27903.1 hypothetical protein DCMF_26915 [Candidatus Formimonas warabiya]